MEVQLKDLFEKMVEYTPGGEAKLPGGGGVYLLTDEQDRPIQLASAADLARALRHRLSGVPEEGFASTRRGEPAPEGTPDTQVPAGEGTGGTSDTVAAGTGGVPARRPRLNLGEIVRRIYWRPAHSAFELTYAYYRIARQLRPADYFKQVGFGPAWFVHVDPAAAIPRFQAGKILQGRPSVDIGPLATQADAVALIELLQDAFDLCRYYHILEQVPHGQPCAYFEMGRCPAPCNGSIPMGEYRASIEAALQFAIGRREPLYERLTSDMREAAAGRAFERAGMLKQRFDRARRIEHEAFRYVAPVDTFDWLIVQRGPGSTRVRPFFVRGGLITPGEPTPLKSMNAAAVDWVVRMRETVAAPEVENSQELQLRSEHVWLVSHFLFKPTAPGLYRRARDLADPGALSAEVREKFKRPERPVVVEEPQDGRTSNTSEIGTLNPGSTSPP